MRLERRRKTLLTIENTTTIDHREDVEKKRAENEEEKFENFVLSFFPFSAHFLKFSSIIKFSAFFSLCSILGLVSSTHFQLNFTLNNSTHCADDDAADSYAHE